MMKLIYDHIKQTRFLNAFMGIKQRISIEHLQFFTIIIGINLN